MDPVSAKGLSGLGGLGGKMPAMRAKGKPGAFEATRVGKLDAQSRQTFDGAKVGKDFMQTGRMRGMQAPTMSERVAMQDGISFQNHRLQVSGTEHAWRPNQVQASGKSESVASAMKDLNSGQQRMDSIIGELRSGKEFSQSELIGLQAEVNVLSQQIQLSTKLVDSAMQSLKQVMQQQA